MTSSSGACAYCDLADDGRPDWLYVEVSRVSPEADDVNDTVGLEFCGQPHAAAYLAERELAWEEPGGGADTTSGLWVGRLFLTIGLVAILLSTVGVVALLRWIF